MDSCFWAAELPKSVSAVPKCPASVLEGLPHSTFQLISSHQSSSGHLCYWPLSQVLVLAAALEYRYAKFFYERVGWALGHQGGLLSALLGAPVHESLTICFSPLSISGLASSFLPTGFPSINIRYAQRFYLAYSLTGITWAGWTAISLCFLCQDWSQAESGRVLGSPWIRAAVGPRSLAVGYPGQNGPAGYVPQPPGLGSRSPLGRSGPGSGAVCWLREKSAACTGPRARR